MRLLAVLRRDREVRRYLHGIREPTEVHTSAGKVTPILAVARPTHQNPTSTSFVPQQRASNVLPPKYALLRLLCDCSNRNGV
jgi:hypothetical protein